MPNRHLTPSNGGGATQRYKPKTKSVAAMGLPDVAKKIMERSYQRAGVVAGGTLLSSGARQATVALQPATFRKVHLAAAKAGVSFSEMIRQCVDKTLNGG